MIVTMLDVQKCLPQLRQKLYSVFVTFFSSIGYYLNAVTFVARFLVVQLLLKRQCIDYLHGFNTVIPTSFTF